LVDGVRVRSPAAGRSPKKKFKLNIIFYVGQVKRTVHRGSSVKSAARIVLRYSPEVFEESKIRTLLIIVPFIDIVIDK
jgi:hypothetical protein